MNEFLKGILDGINTVIGNYGWSIVVFTLLLRIVLFPFDYKSRVSMRKTTKLQPQLAALQKKYANDKEKLNRKMSELYKKERSTPVQLPAHAADAAHPVCHVDGAAHHCQ